MSKKTLGQIAHEAFAKHSVRPANPWHVLRDSTKNSYEIMAKAVKAAVSEESICACPSCRTHHRWLAEASVPNFPTDGDAANARDALVEAIAWSLRGSNRGTSGRIILEESDEADLRAALKLARGES